jgi:hypothetical protein
LQRENSLAADRTDGEESDEYTDEEREEEDKQQQAVAEDEEGDSSDGATSSSSCRILDCSSTNVPQGEDPFASPRRQQPVPSSTLSAEPMAEAELRGMHVPLLPGQR